MMSELSELFLILTSPQEKEKGSRFAGEEDPRRPSRLTTATRTRFGQPGKSVACGHTQDTHVVGAINIPPPARQAATAA